MRVESFRLKAELRTEVEDVMYAWRSLTPEQQREVLAFRIQQHRPWHSPPHLFSEGQFHITAACYEHAPHIGLGLLRITEFTQKLQDVFSEGREKLLAWCVLPNHYHLLAETTDLRRLKRELGKLHGRTAHVWNLAEKSVGRTVWHRCADHPALFLAPSRLQAERAEC